MPFSLNRLAPIALAIAAATAGAQSTVQPAAASFDKLKALAGDWIDLDGTLGAKGAVAVTYRVTGGGNAVIETLFAGTRSEMVTVYNKDGSHVVLTHFCAAGNQPRMRATTSDGNSLAFDFDGGTNVDPARDAHMHSGRIEFVGPDRVRAQWSGWANGKPSSHMPVFNLERKKA
jgi:hypothetical protein